MNQFSFRAEVKEDGQNGFIHVTTFLANEIYQASHYVALSALRSGLCVQLAVLHEASLNWYTTKEDIRVFVSLMSRLAQF